MYRSLIAAMVLSVAVPAGAATAPAPISPKPVSTEELKNIKTIALLHIENFPSYRGVDLAAFAEQRLTERLNAKGYRVIVRTVAREQKYHLIENYRSLKMNDVEAFLDAIFIQVGHVKTNVAIPFSRERGPSVWMNFRLVSAQTGEILYAETVQYGDQQNPMIDGATLPAPTDHKFESVDEVKANISKLFDYIKSGIDSIASAVADRLAR